MSPLADLVDIPPWQFLWVYGGVAFFGAVFLAYLRWEVVHGAAPGAAPDPAAERRAWLKLRLAIAAVTLGLLALGAVKIQMNLARAKPVLGIALEMIAAAAGGLAIGVWPRSGGDA